MPLYPYQERVDALLRAGRNVLLQAPTGAGKTRAALFPFLDGWRSENAVLFPRQCIYAVPMRVLANQFEAEYRRIVADYSTRFGLLRSVSIQTGARAEDRRFDGDLVFTTIDQVLSGFLTIPYGLSNRQANLNAGAVIGSYLVFDEFHLFPVDESGNGALTTTLQILQMLKGITPFVLMTATFSSTMITRLAELLDAEPVSLTAAEIDALPSHHRKRRTYHYRDIPMSAEGILSDMQAHRRRRVIAICNTVDRAQDLARELRLSPRCAGARVEVLHSRFYASDRADKEELLRREFGEDRSAASDVPMILVATQVVEVGLNITCETLHTDLAPAASLIQRAGRCARFAGEAGDVYVYELPLNDRGKIDYAPYLDEGQRPLCEETRVALVALLPADGRVLTYPNELALVDAAHTRYDAQLLETLQQRRHQLRGAIERTLRKQDRSLARELIRDVDTRTIIIHPEPTDVTVPNPYHYQGIAVRPGRLVRWYDVACERAWELGLDWVAKIAQVQETADGIEGGEQRRGISTNWSHVLRPTTDPKEQRNHKAELWSAGSIVVLNPALAQYTVELGLQLLPGSTPATESPRLPRGKGRERGGPIHHETYAEHIAGLYRVYREALRDRTAAARRRLEQRFGLREGTLDRAIRLMFAAHDLGKLDRSWQGWAHRWQARAAELRHEPSIAFPPGYMAAHTDFDAQDSREVAAQREVRPPRPRHAAESARAGRDLITAVAAGDEALRTALMSAIICHHSAHLRSDHGSFTPAPGAKAAFYDAMRAVGLFEDERLRASK
ncbi:MAG: hypothetical protein RLZZ387_896, partial [Chloroflexota bacterium]